MGLRIAHDTDGSVACLYDSVSGWAFGPIFEGMGAEDKAQSFIDWLPLDARAYDLADLENLHAKWTTIALDQNGELIENEAV